MQIHKNISLKPYNTFKINCQAAYFATFSTLDELNASVAFANENKEMPLMILGGGSNILLTHDYQGLVLKNEMKGIELVNEDAKNYYVRCAAGENWHQFVLHCIRNNYAGVENLSLIPGNVGASPMQNIGAYGVEIKDVFYQLEALHLADKKMVTFNLADCRFGYRDSIFKTTYKGEFVITSVTFKLNKKPVYQVEYGAIKSELNIMGVEELSIAAISQAIINIRQNKLPDPAVIGNAGSFFKNPTVPKKQFNELQATYPGIVGYTIDDNKVKLAAGWLIEQCGWKGYRKGDAGCHEKQALVLVNHDNATGLDIYNLSATIMHSVEEKFFVLLEREVNVL